MGTRADYLLLPAAGFHDLPPVVPIPTWNARTRTIQLYTLFLGSFATLLKATISFVMSVRLSVRPHGTTLLPLDGFS